MEIAIFICIYWIWIIDNIKGIGGNVNTIVPSTGAVILISWQQSQAWGIIMTLIGVTCVILCLIRYAQNNKKNFTK